MIANTATLRAAIALAREVQRLMKDPRSVAALNIAEAYADDTLTAEEFAAGVAYGKDALVAAAGALRSSSSKSKLVSFLAAAAANDALHATTERDLDRLAYTVRAARA